MRVGRRRDVQMPNLAAASWGRLSAMRPIQRLALSALLGGASAFGFAPLYLWPLMLVAFCGLVWLLDTAKGAKQAAACGLCFGFAHFAVGLYWVAISFQFQADLPIWFGWAAVVALAAYLALYPAAAMALCWTLWSQRPTRILVLAGSWAAGEWLRGHLFGGFPWNSVAQIWADSPLMLQTARWAGSYGLSLLTVALFASVALLVDWRRAAGRALLIAGAVGTVMIADGWWRMSDVEPGSHGLRVHLVQPNIRQDLKTDPKRRLEILEAYEGLTAAALKQRGPGLVIWPETAVHYDVAGDGVTRFRLARLLGPTDALILGTVGQKFTTDGKWVGSRNSLVAINSAGEITGAYDKVQLVPFGEYLPAAGLLSKLGLTSVAAGGARFLPGEGPVTLAPGTPPFSPLICYEIIFPGRVVAPGPRPEWILNISNDAWFGDSSGPHQHLAQARLRAVEEGLPVVRSTPTGISAVIDPYGRSLARTGLGDKVVLTADVPTPAGRTLYARLGDWSFLALLLASLLIGRAAWPTRLSLERTGFKHREV